MKKNKEDYPGQLAARARVVRGIYIKVTALMQNEPNRLKRLAIARDVERIAAYMDREGLSYVG
jgi:hypothetical protein